ncbi:MAG: metallophosphatase family protein [Candidatus Hydrogenedentota bacterium]|nr:MAG: metallophosphatase family protein [Candidatus Hydrogenedentota bacterium]
MSSDKKPGFKPGEPNRTETVLLEPDSVCGIVASTHGDAEALEEMLRVLKDEYGVTKFFHAGDITGEASEPSRCLKLLQEHQAHCILGNHDVLLLDREFIHTYGPVAYRAAEETVKALGREEIAFLDALPVRIRTSHFSIVHESVLPPHYAKRSKRRRRSHGWDVGSSADENTSAVCYGRLAQPHFLGSDHAAYYLHARPLLKVERPEPGNRIRPPRCSVFSVPSLAFTRDERYDAGAVVVRLLDRENIEVEYLSLTPTKRSDIFPGIF